MSDVVVFTSPTLDGVMQTPSGAPNEDRRGGFAHGGWALLYNDSVMSKVPAEEMADAGPCCSGGGAQIQSLRQRGLIDRYVLLIHPLVLGSGRRLFPDWGVRRAAAGRHHPGHHRRAGRHMPAHPNRRQTRAPRSEREHARSEA